MPAQSATVTAFETALPDDPRIERKQMFSSPCAFVNRQMFFGIFEDTLVARVGPSRVRALDGQDGMSVFTLGPDKRWDDYVQLAPTADPGLLSALATESLAWAAALPKKVKRSKRG